MSAAFISDSNRIKAVKLLLWSSLNPIMKKSPRNLSVNLRSFWKQLFQTSPLSVHPSHFNFFPIPAVISKNVANKTCLACVKSEKYVVWVTLRPLGFMQGGETELLTLQY